MNTKHKIKAIFFDIDGTLLSFKTHVVPPSTIEAFSKLKKQGIKLFIATGRALGEINNLDDLTFDGYISMNGAYCVNSTYEVIHKDAIPSEDIDALIRYLEEEEQFPCIATTAENNVVNCLNEQMLALSRLVDLPLPQIKNFREIDKDHIFQLALFVDQQKETEIMQNVLVHCQSSRWHHSFADANKMGVSKQSGIDRMLEYHGIQLSETMAFGDGGNDISMLQHVAIGVAMGNADENVKSVADYVTDSVDDDGIMKALQQLLW